jgi:hypothetical protein
MLALEIAIAVSVGLLEEAQELATEYIMLVSTLGADSLKTVELPVVETEAAYGIPSKSMANIMQSKLFLSIPNTSRL